MVQVVMGLRRMKKKTFSWRFMQRYEAMKKSKGSGRAIIATARKMATVIWNMLTEDVEFNIGLMIDRKLAKKSASMTGLAGAVNQTLNEGQEKSLINETEKKGKGVKKNVKKLALPVEKKKFG